MKTREVGIAGACRDRNSKNNPIAQVDPFGLCSCPGGEWNQEFGDSTLSLAFGGYADSGDAGPVFRFMAGHDSGACRAGVTREWDFRVERERSSTASFLNLRSSFIG